MATWYKTDIALSGGCYGYITPTRQGDILYIAIHYNRLKVETTKLEKKLLDQKHMLSKKKLPKKYSPSHHLYCEDDNVLSEFNREYRAILQTSSLSHCSQHNSGTDQNNTRLICYEMLKKSS